MDLRNASPAVEYQDDQNVATGMDGLNSRRFINNPPATADGELPVETSTESIRMKILVPLE